VFKKFGVAMLDTVARKSDIENWLKIPREVRVIYGKSTQAAKTVLQRP
jgi:hypothetical protein